MQLTVSVLTTLMLNCVQRLNFSHLMTKQHFGGVWNSESEPRHIFHFLHMCIWPEWYNSGLSHNVHQCDSRGESCLWRLVLVKRSVEPPWRLQFEQFLSGMWGVCRDVFCLLPGPLQVLDEEKISINEPLCTPDSLLQSGPVLLHDWDEPDNDWCT